MDALQYLLLVNIYLVLFYSFYSLFLKNETFFKLNRVYLVGGAIMSFLIPFLQSEWIRSLFITQQVEVVTRNISMNFTGQAVIIPTEQQAFSTGEVILLVYITGAAICFLRFLWQLYNVQLVLRSGKSNQAFSFFNRIEVGNSVPNRQTVYDHELVHVKQWHSVDVILFEIIAIINWFNPVVYLYRKAVKYIHEFTADEIAARHEESKSAYAMVLVSKTFGVPTHQLTNSFYNHSLLKRRIIMLHKSKSRRNALLKYGLSAPLFAAMMVLSSASGRSEKVADKISEVSMQALEIIQPDTVKLSKYEEFLKRNSGVQSLEWKSESKVVVVLKNGNKESYDLDNDAELKTAENLYGRFPMSPPPPPPVPMSQKGTLQVSKAENGPTFTEVEVSPEFPGGMEAFYQYLAKSFKYPESARSKNLSGKIILQFVVETDGILSDIRVLRGLGSGLDEEAVRVLAQSAKWKPGIQNGKAVRVAYTLPMTVNPPSQKTGSTVITTDKEKLSVAGLDKDALYILDGKEVTPAAINVVDAKSVKAVNVLKDAPAIAKYGEKGKNGVVEVYVNAAQPITATSAATIGGTNKATQASTADKPGNLALNEVVVNGYGSASKAGTVNITTSAMSGFDGLVIIDGKEAKNKDGKALSRIKPNDIQSINVIKGEQAVKTYGERGKDGVIQVTLKKK
ncbi:TonB family protein [Flavihumibacter sp. R14]|nr:TonB family protein [Flavihumibacter soli]